MPFGPTGMPSANGLACGTESFGPCPTVATTRVTIAIKTINPMTTDDTTATRS